MPNRLSAETSPYLLQHAANPVDWYPWGEDAFRKAREEDRPILLSVGYSACHWCHVMAHESFEDPKVAATMNRLFVNVKVDREERPDVDQIYQSAHQALTQRPGGWPLTMFLTPDGRPFFGGTYFPPTPRYNLPGFETLLERVETAYRTQRQEIDAQNSELVGILQRAGDSAPLEAGAGMTGRPIDQARSRLLQLIDPVHGGLGTAPKFPHPFELGFLLRSLPPDAPEETLVGVHRTLSRMALGGLRDHLAGGFFRYSVDDRWQIPHFEKMLYDNAALLRLYADAYGARPDPLYLEACDTTAGWLMAEMQLPDGGFCSSLDADSEGQEGRFYVWDRDAVQSLLAPQQYRAFAARFGLDGPPNFEDSHWHLGVTTDWADLARRLGIAGEEARRLVEEGRQALGAARAERVRPGRDDKVLTSWNALTIASMARAGRLLGRPAWVESARRALDFIRSHLWVDGRLLATARDGRAHLPAYLDDHAFLLEALLETLRAGFSKEDLDWACVIADRLIDGFADPERGGFWFTSHDHEQLIVRSKSIHDNATPSGSGVAAKGLQRLGHLVGEPRYIEAAERTLRAHWEVLEQQPHAAPSLLAALQESLDPPATMIVRGESSAVAGWMARLSALYVPHCLALGIPGDVPGLPPALAKPADDGVNAWLCRGVVCLPPIASLDEAILAARTGRGVPDGQ